MVDLNRIHQRMEMAALHRCNIASPNSFSKGLRLERFLPDVLIITILKHWSRFLLSMLKGNQRMPIFITSVRITVPISIPFMVPGLI